MSATRLHRRLAAAAALCALAAFISGAGLDAPLAIPAALLLLLAIVWQPSARAQRLIEPVLRVIALLLAGRAGVIALRGGADVVAPMVDLLFLLLAAEALRASTRTGALRLYALSFALLVAASAYRPGMFFGMAFIAFIVLLTVALVVGHIAGQAERRGGVSRAPVVPGRFVLMTALLSSVVLLTSAAVFISFPRVTRNWMARGETPARSVVGFSDVVSIGEHGAVIESNPEIVLRVEFPDGVPTGLSGLHWRGRSYNRFDGVRWHRSQLGPYGAPLSGGRRGNAVRQLVYARTLPTSPVFGLHQIVDVQPRSRIWPVREANGDVRYMGRAAPVYLVRSVTVRPSAATLRAAPLRVPITMTPYLQLPALPQRVHDLAESLTTGAPTAYDRALRIETFLQREFAYTRALPRTTREATLDHFLFERRAGHCEYFSTAMVVLLRSVGVPARNVNGFLGGRWNEFGDYLAVSQNEAHSWVEVWFAGVGWVEFDPTPVGAAGDQVAASRSAGDRWLAWLDGFEHRWNKWVLDYALEDQVDLLRRVSESFHRADGGTAASEDSEWPRVLPWLVVLVTGTVAGWLVIRRGGGASAGEPTRSYLALRHAYARAGLDAWSAPPRAFAARLSAADVPGAAHAAAAVELYLRGRFSAHRLRPHERAQLKHHVQAARAAVRQSSGGWMRRRRSRRS